MGELPIPLTASFAAAKSPPHENSNHDSDRFAPGSVLAERFRIVTSLGKGGMGEVFRADDLALGQSVALKFLPRKLAHNPERTQRLRGEVKTARQVAHPNVCRVYDLGQDGDELFLSMEYIDGQNLAGLLAQIRRLPEERGVEIARQLCLGLGAIHDRGLLHRDLKPANVMIDGRGQVRITDFGLAVPAENLSTGDARDGTPAYQAPEQLAGREVTQRSDLYALGLILFELFTGKRPFPTPERASPTSGDAPLTPSKPTSHIASLHPGIERIILKCLEADPAERPRSAYEVLAELPGGDPLQAALAAGKTPSPEEVADANIEGTLHPLVALALVAAVVALIAFVVGSAGYFRLFQVVPQPHSPAELARRAVEILRVLGHSEQANYVQYGLDDSTEVINYLRKRSTSHDRWRPLTTTQPPALYFWYRQSPEPMHPRITTTPNANDPPCTTLGMVRLCLDMKGRLIEFESGPSKDPPHESLPPWTSILELAGLANVQPKTPDDSTLKPPQGTQDRQSWAGVYADCPEIPCQVEAGLRDNRLHYFHVRPADASDWGRGWLADTPSLNQATVETKLSVQIVIGILFFSTFVIWLAFAWHNVRLGRANVPGAVIFGVIMGTANYVARLSELQYPGRISWLSSDEILNALGSVVVASLIMGLLYAAIEPFIRRRWAWRVVAWNRLLKGRWFDPLVGRDVLLGTFAGLLLRAAGQVVLLIPSWMHQPPLEPTATVSLYRVVRPLIGEVASELALALSNTLYLVLLFFLVFLVTRREWLTASLFILVPSVLAAFEPDIGRRVPSMLLTPIVMIVFVGLSLRYGLLAVAIAAFVRLLTGNPLTWDSNVWYSDRSYSVLAIISALIIYGVIVSTRTRWSSWIASITTEPVPA